MPCASTPRLLCVQFREARTCKEQGAQCPARISLLRQKRDARAFINTSVVLVLAVVMLTLLVTSVLISNTLFAALQPDSAFDTPVSASVSTPVSAKQLHALAAYWGLIIVSLHVGTRWTMLMGIARRTFAITNTSAMRTWTLRLAAVALAVQGVRSSFALDISAKLFLQPAPEWWDFSESSAGFFLHCIAIAGLYAAISYYTLYCV